MPRFSRLTVIIASLDHQVKDSDFKNNSRNEGEIAPEILRK